MIEGLIVRDEFELVIILLASSSLRFSEAFIAEGPDGAPALYWLFELMFPRLLALRKDFVRELIVVP